MRDPKKTAQIKVRLSPDERHIFRSVALGANLTVSAWARQSLRDAAALWLAARGRRAPWSMGG